MILSFNKYGLIREWLIREWAYTRVAYTRVGLYASGLYVGGKKTLVKSVGLNPNGLIYRIFRYTSLDFENTITLHCVSVYL